jgi:hypothetical protein
MNGEVSKVGDKPIERTNALTLIRDSKEYYEYYLRGKPASKSDISKVSYFLLTRSLELGLKAILKIKEGITVLELREKYGHNVYKLYSYCSKNDYLPTLDKEYNTALEMLNFYYKDKDFEYTRTGYKTLPDLSYIITLIKQVHETFNKISQSTELKRYI